MKARLALILLLLLLATHPSCGHRMMMGYQVNELQVTALYDDGTPAQGVEIEVQSDGETIEKGLTDEKGAYVVRPSKGTGDLTFVTYSTGHRAELNLDLTQKEAEEEVSRPLRAAAGFGYLLGAAGLAMIFISRKKR
ncbi:MAG: hypothetical protein MUE87_00835 [Methanothrix sp.]|jgi:nickel transport protein|nr:hypothetical protein [Methanothrix sp.]